MKGYDIPLSLALQQSLILYYKNLSGCVKIRAHDHYLNMCKHTPRSDNPVRVK